MADFNKGIIFRTFFYIGMITVADGFHTGHMKPLGEQRVPEGHIETIENIPHGKSFYYDYSLTKKPVILKNAAAHIPSFQWNDSYMRRKYGHILVDVAQKKLDETTETRKYIFKEFIKTYRKKELDISMIHPLRDELLSDMRLLPFFVCGGHLNVLQEAYLWFTGKNTKSVLKKNPYDNVMCLFGGKKQFYMIHPKDGEFVKQDGPADKFPSSLLDVDAVDLDKYSGIGKAPWWEAKMEAGDCIYIPADWWHQSISHVSEIGKNMEFNIFYYHLDHINMTECEQHTSVDTNTYLVSLDGINLNDVNTEAIRFLVKLEVYNKPSITRQKLFEAILKDLPNHPTKFSDFPILANEEEKITVDELHQLTEGEIFTLKRHYPLATRRQDFMHKINKFIYIPDPVSNSHDEL